MGRVRVCGVCWKPVKECICEDEEGVVSLNPLSPVPYDGPVHDADG